MSYCSTALLRDRLGNSAADLDALIQQAVDWATAEIDSLTGRRFEAFSEVRHYDRSALDWASANTSRFDYTSYGWRTLELDEDLLTVTTLTNGDGVVIPSNQFILEPRNVLPRHRIRLLSPAAWVFPIDGTITVDGDWGYSATPDAMIQGTCLRLAEWYYKSNKLPDAINPFSGNVTPRPGPFYPPEAVTSLERLIRLTR